ncbi:serine/threonine-protein kinase [Streptomyces sp. NPDC017056]|uniref:serine/threonine-protein kinase n=1 Tax=Streptomyces sp. NPDC017056 TaxID=3364973 RepID=UPI003792750F
MDDGRLVAGRYRLVEEIGRGGMGTVWLAHDELLGRQVAVKRLHVSPELDADELARRNERTRREAQAAARINHPNVVSVHDVVDDAGLPCIVMEYVPSVTLGDVIKEATAADGAVPLGEMARIGRGMIAALRAAHAAGVLHRDVKPGNVLLGEDGRVVLTDFGIAVASGTSTLTKTGELVGSIDYLAPERVKGGTPGPASDLWALGATLYQALEGRPPFRKLTAVETAYSIAVDPLDPPRNAGPLTPLIEALLAKEPADRPTAQAVEQALRVPAADADTTWANPSAPCAGADGMADTGGTRHTRHTGRTEPADRTDRTDDTKSTGGTNPTGVTSATGFGPATGYTSYTSATGGTPGAARADGATASVHPALAYPATAAPAGATTPATPAPTKKRGRALLWSAVAVVVVLGVTGGVLYSAGLWQGDGVQASDGAPQNPETSPVTPKPKPKPTRPVPSGYHRVTEPASGLPFPLPNGWTRTEKQGGGGSNYRDPANPLVSLRIEVLDFANTDALQHWKDNEKAALKEGRFPGYQQLRMHRTAFRGQPAALWEWKWAGSAREYRAIDLGFGKPGEKEYAIYLSAPAAEWEKYKKVFDDVQAGIVLPEDQQQ